MTQNPPVHRQKALLMVGISYLSFIVLAMPTAPLLGIAWPHIRDGFHIAQDDVGYLYLTTSLAYFAASFISGRLIARFGMALPLIASATLGTLGLLGYALSPAWVLIVLLGLVVGFGGGLLDSGMNILFAANFGPRLMNWLHASFGVGAIIGPLMMTAILQSGASWAIGFVVVAALYLVLAVTFVVTRHWWSITTPQQTHSAPTRGASASSTLRLQVVWLLIGLFLAYAGLESSAGQWSPVLFKESRQVAEATVGIWISIYGASFTIGRIFFGFIVHRFKTVSMIRFCMVGIIFGMFLLWWNPSVILGYIGLLIFGFTLAPVFALMITSTQDRLGPVHAPNAIGFEIAAASVGVGFLTGVAGVLAKNNSLEIVPPFLLVFCILMAVLYEIIISPRIVVPNTPVVAGD